MRVKAFFYFVNVLFGLARNKGIDMKIRYWVNDGKLMASDCDLRWNWKILLELDTDFQFL